MAALLVLLVLLVPAASGSDVQQTHPGEDVTLSCQVDGSVSIRAVEWTRDDLKTKEYVLFHSDGHSITKGQHPSFKDRVELVDRELKNGDVSLILRNVNVNDSGTYECRVAVGGSGRKKRAIIKTTPIRSVQLEVTVVSGVVGGGSKNKNPTDGNHNHAGLGAGLGLVFLAVVVVVVVRKSKKHTNNQSEEPAAAEAVGDQICFDSNLCAVLSAGESCGSTHDPPP